MSSETFQIRSYITLFFFFSTCDIHTFTRHQSAPTLSLTLCSHPQNVLRVGTPDSSEPKPLPDQPSGDPIMQALYPSLLQPRSALPQLLQHLMFDMAGCQPHPEPVIVETGPGVPGSAAAGTNDGSPLYVEGALMMQGMLAR